MKALLLLAMLCQAELIGSWAINEDSGTVIHDVSGNGHDGRLWSPLHQSKWVDGSLVFDGTNSIIISDHMANFSIRSWTITMMINKYQMPHGFAGSDSWFLIQKSDGDGRFSIEVSAKNTILGRAGTIQLPDSGLVIPDSQWCFIGVTFQDGDYYEMFLNDNHFQIGTTTSPKIIPSISDVTIGTTTGYDSTWNFHGMIKNVMVFDHALPTDSVLSIYKNISIEQRIVNIHAFEVSISPNPFQSSTLIRSVGISNIYTIDGRLIHTNKGNFVWNAPSVGQYLLRNSGGTKKMIVVR